MMGSEVGIELSRKTTSPLRLFFQNMFLPRAQSTSRVVRVIPQLTTLDLLENETNICLPPTSSVFTIPFGRYY